MAFKIFVKPVNCDIYSKCREMLLDNYCEYLLSQDTLWFSNYYELLRTNQNVNKPHKKELEKAFNSFFGDMLSITKNPRILDRFGHIHEILKYQTKYKSVTTILNCLYSYDMRLGEDLLNQHIENLERWNYKLDRNIELYAQLDKIRNRVQGLLTEIQLLEKQISDDDIEEATNLDEDILAVTTFLDLRYPIDKKTTYVSEWLSYCEMAQKKSLVLKSKNFK